MYVTLKPVKMRRYREQKGMSRQALAASSRVSAPTIGKTESGRYIPYDTELQRIAVVLGVDNPADLLEPIEG